jgi:hypothetical protein
MLAQHSSALDFTTCLLALYSYIRSEDEQRNISHILPDRHVAGAAPCGPAGGGADLRAFRNSAISCSSRLRFARDRELESIYLFAISPPLRLLEGLHSGGLGGRNPPQWEVSVRLIIPRTVLVDAVCCHRARDRWRTTLL